MQYNQDLEKIQQQMVELQKLADDHEINEAKLIEQVRILRVLLENFGF